LNKLKQPRGKPETSSPLELLLPAGNSDALIAALEGGADAVYFGLSKFNARNRAKNFYPDELASALQKVKSYKAKAYLVLNTLIKNSELSEVVSILSSISRLAIDAVIVQDWGLFWLIKRYFPKLICHASTQMGNHNSLDCTFAMHQGFARVILARELSLSEIQGIGKRSRAELEVFIHGALCYSFSGYCLFSSWMGGFSANRGACKQPCRRDFAQPTGSTKPFCMRDLELIDDLPKLAQAGVKSLKIEGRMRSSEYVYNVARAYRMALDDESKITEAKRILSEDGGRSKTALLFSDGLESYTTEQNQAGIIVGEVSHNDGSSIGIKCSYQLSKKHRLYFYDNESRHWDLQILSVSGQSCTAVGDLLPDKGKLIYRYADSTHKTFAFKAERKVFPKADMKYVQSVLGALVPAKRNTQIKPIVWIRIATLEQYNALKGNHDTRIICPLTICLEVKAMDMVPETPLFIAEGQVSQLKKTLHELISIGFKHYAISRLSHLRLFQDTQGIEFVANEHVYCLNDASIQGLSQRGIHSYVSPLENDYPNLLRSNYRHGIIPMYFNPPLFSSRIKPEIEHALSFEGKKLIIDATDAWYKVVPEEPTCLFQFHAKLTKQGYQQFLIDLSYTQSSEIAGVLDSFHKAKQIPGSNTFNFKKGLH